MTFISQTANKCLDDEYCNYTALREKMIIMLKIVFCWLIILTGSHGDTSQAAAPSCSFRPASDINAPPGLPGRPGSKGEPGVGTFIKNIDKKWF